MGDVSFYYEVPVKTLAVTILRIPVVHSDRQ